MDYTLFKIINGLAGKYFLLDKLMIYIALYIQYLFGVALLLFWFKKGSKDEVIENRRSALFSMLTLGAAAIVNFVIGLFYFRPRPFVSHAVNFLIKHPANASFPSDHATAAFALAFPILFVNKRYGWVMIVMAVLLSFSRIYVGVHYPADIITGILISYGVFYLIKKYYKYPNLITEYVLKLWDWFATKIMILIHIKTQH